MNAADKATEDIDRLIHDAQHKDGGQNFARMMGHHEQARRMARERDSLIAEARRIFSSVAGAKWPHVEDCDWPATQEPGESAGSLSGPAAPAELPGQTGKVGE